MEVIYYPILFLLCHFVGDFWLQTDWMTMNKSKSSLHCFVHCLIYTACFLILTTSWKALLFIFVTHFILDRWHGIIKRMIWVKNHFPTFQYPPFAYCNTTGYYDDSPYNTMQRGKEMGFGKPRHFFITIWIYIISDNVLHLTCNLLALLCLV